MSRRAERKGHELGRSSARTRGGTRLPWIVALGATALALGALTACGGTSDGAGGGGGCEPSLAVLTASGRGDGPAEVVAGSVAAVTGTGFASGCGGSGDEAGDGTPIEGVHLVLVQGSSSREVARVDAAGDDRSFEATVEVPDGLAAGPAQIRAQQTDELEGEPIAAVELVVAEP